MFCLSVHLLVDICVASMFWLLYVAFFYLILPQDHCSL